MIPNPDNTETPVQQDVKDEEKLPPPPVKTKRQIRDEKNVNNPHYRKLENLVFINNSNYNMEIHTRHHSGMRVKSLISSDYTKWVEEYEKKKSYADPNIIDPIITVEVHRMYYPEFPLFRMNETSWEKNQKIAYEIIITKEQISWDDKPEFAIVERPRPPRPNKI